MEDVFLIAPIKSRPFKSFAGTAQELDIKGPNTELLEQVVNQLLLKKQELVEQMQSEHFKKLNVKDPLSLFDLSLKHLVRVGFHDHQINKLYRGLYVYSKGFYSMINTVLQNSDAAVSYNLNVD